MPLVKNLKPETRVALKEKLRALQGPIEAAKELIKKRRIELDRAVRWLEDAEKDLEKLTAENDAIKYDLEIP